MTKVDPREEPPFTFHERKIKKINPDISDDFELIIEHAVQYKPEDRYQNVMEMKADLDKLINGDDQEPIRNQQMAVIPKMQLIYSLSNRFGFLNVKMKYEVRHLIMMIWSLWVLMTGICTR